MASTPDRPLLDKVLKRPDSVFSNPIDRRARRKDRYSSSGAISRRKPGLTRWERTATRRAAVE